MTDLTRSIQCKICKGDLWDMWGNTAKCFNCGHTRPYYRRSVRDDKITPSQERAAQVIKRYFSAFGEAATEITAWEPELQEGTGIYYIRVETGTGNVWTLDGGFFAITRRGAIRVLNTYRLTDDTKAHEKHIATMVGGKVGW